MSPFALQILTQISYFVCFMAFAFTYRWLRILSILSCVLTIVCCALVPAGVLWIPIYWNLAFIGAHGAHLVLGLKKKLGVTLDPLETFLSKTILTNFPAEEVKTFIGCASEGELPEGKLLIKEGTELQRLFCILDGLVTIEANGKVITDLKPGNFVGEMSLLTHSKTRANVVTKTPVKLLVWPHEEIEKWVGSNPQRLTLLQTAMGSQIVHQLLRQMDSQRAEEKVG